MDKPSKPVLELGIEFVVELLLFLIPFGAEQMGLPHSFWLGLVCWLAAAAIAIRMFWIFPIGIIIRRTRLEKALIATMFVGVLVVVFEKPIQVAYDKRNPPTDVQAITSPSEAKRPSVDVPAKAEVTVSSREKARAPGKIEGAAPKQKPAPTTQSQSCPGGICIGGDNSGDPVVINTEKPLPTISWKVHEQPPEGGKNPAIYVDLAPDDSLSNPTFSAECSRPCESESGGLSTGGSMFMPEVGYDVTNPNIAILHFKMPAFLGKGEPVHWIIRSKDNQKIVIRSIRAVTL